MPLFLQETVPDVISPSSNPLLRHIASREQFIEEVTEAFSKAPMAVRVSPHVLSCINWDNVLDDPVRRQFIPLKSAYHPNHPMTEFDSLHEEADSPVPGLVHRYPNKALFIGEQSSRWSTWNLIHARFQVTSTCPVYCQFCTRCQVIGGETGTHKKRPQKPSQSRYDKVYKYLEDTPAIEDVVISGGDPWTLSAYQLLSIGNRSVTKGSTRIRGD